MGSGEIGNVPVEPDEALGGSVLLLLELVEDEVLEGLGECGGSELAVTDFLERVNCALYCVIGADSYLDVAGHVALDWLESCGAQNIYNPP